MPSGIVAENIAGLSIGGQGIAAAGPRIGQEPQVYTAGSYSFVPPRAGRWKFVLWGGGGGVTGSTAIGGDSGAYVEVTRYLNTAQTVQIIVGIGQANTTVAFPDGTSAIAGGANGSTGGIATGGDVNLNGSASVSGAAAPNSGAGTGGGAGGNNGGGVPGGAGAPANLPYRGGAGAGFGAGQSAPGHGAGMNGNTVSMLGPPGLALAVLVQG